MDEEEVEVALGVPPCMAQTGVCGRNYCAPTFGASCGERNRGVTWVYTDNNHTPRPDCQWLDGDQANRYCAGLTIRDGGFKRDCYNTSGSDYICVKDICNQNAYNQSHKLNCCLGITNNVDNCYYAWCPSQLDVCRNVLSTYCGRSENVATNEVCRNFCSLEQNKVYCDAAMNDYCNTGDNHRLPICACVTSTIPQPSCFDAACTSQGYKRADQLEDARHCGTFCGQIINCLETRECNVDRNQFIINCPGERFPDGGGGDDGGGGVVPSFPWLVTIVIGGIILLLVLFLIYYFFFT